MPPTPQERTRTVSNEETPSENGDRIVISGMSGMFPQSKNVQDLFDLLYNKVPSEVTPRYSCKHPEVVASGGSVPDLHLFDAQFFKVHHKLGQVMEPTGRKLLEHSYQAIYDAGINPAHLFGKKIGVYVGSSLAESEKFFCYGTGSKKTAACIMGCSKTMIANRISYWLNGKGPSMTLDQACCSSTAALEQAYQAIKRGECEAAIVGGASLTLHPQSSIHYNRADKIKAKMSRIPEIDKQELEAIEGVYCKKRTDTLLVGSVMSNIGYTESSTGVTAVTKVLLGYHTGKIAANQQCSNPRQDIKALREGSMRIVTEHKTFNRGLAAVNGLSTTGVNSHILLHGNYKPKDVNKYKSNIPRIVAVSGRHEEAVQYMLDSLKNQPIDPEQIGLLHGIHHTSLTAHIARGYTILDTDEMNKTVSVGESVQYSDTKRPLWFVYSGMGSQWAGMGTQLLRIPIFAAAIQRCHNVLEPKGMNIFEIITSPDKKIFDNILHSFVGIAAIQIGLTDILLAVGLEPEGIIGHSVGELGCAYADGCMTAEEMILAAYSRGMASVKTPFIKGSMAAVGLGYKQVSKLCPPEIDVACHNSAESSTISGPAGVMKEFVARLTDQGVFAKEVPSANIGFHSRYIKEAGPTLLSYLKDVIKSSKPRSKRWVSTSVPESEWDKPAAQLCSPEYHTNNLLNPVLFEESSKHIPSNAVLVEVAPHGLLQAILKRSMPSDVRNFGLTRRGHPDNVILVLQALGNLFIEGLNPKLDMLYPKIEYPVSTGTPFLSNLVKWVHDEKWDLALYDTPKRIFGSTCTYSLSYFDEEFTYLRGNVVRGQVLYPFAASLVLAWDTLAMVMGVPKKSISVKFSDLQIHSQPILHDRRSLKLNITVHRGSGNFEIINDDSKVLTGYVHHTMNPSEAMPLSLYNNNVPEKLLLSEEIYDLLQNYDFKYSGDFRSLETTNTNFTNGMIHWVGNWVTFIDGLLQLNTLHQTNTIAIPLHIRNVTIDIKQHQLWTTKRKTSIPVKLSELYDNTRCGGVIIKNIEFQHLSPRIDCNITLKESKVVNGGQDKVTKVSNYKLECAQLGEYESLQWVEALEISSKDKAVTVIKFKLQVNDTVYVHGGCGALGQAVISLSLAAGARVLTAVSDTRKKMFLLRLFPQLKDEDIGFSRDPNFSDFIMSATKGIGCDLVISTAPSGVKHNAMKVSAPDGMVIDLTQIQDRSKFDMQMSNIDLRHYLIVNVPSLFENEETVFELQALIGHGISRGVVRPLSRITYDAERVSDAFRLLAGSQHRGRVLLRLTDTLPKSCHSFCSKTPMNLVEQILKFAEIKIPKNVNRNMSLTELGLSNSRIPMISRCLRNLYNIAYDDDKISSMTINSMLKLENELTLTPYVDTQGWSKFLKYLAKDEMDATADVVSLPTLANSASLRNDEIEDQSCLCIVPGLEGHHVRFYSLCERLKVSALVLQPSIDFAHESVQDTARKLSQVLLKRGDIMKNFLLLGYETGVILALEMAAILEEQGMTGTIFCLGHSPYELKLVFDEFSSNFTSEEELQDSLLRHMYGLISGTDETDLILRGSWEEKLESTVGELLGHSSHTAQYIKIIIRAFLNRFKKMQSYTCEEPTRALQSKIVVMRAKTLLTDDERHLQLYSQQKLSVYQLTAPLADVTMDLKCAPIINSHLSPDILEEFENKNICDAYLLNEKDFVQVG